MGQKTALYRHWDEGGNLLYVGVSLKPLQRLENHIMDSHWSEQISIVTIEWFDTRHDAEKAEREAIKIEMPLHNVVHASGTTRRRELIRRRRELKPLSPPAQFLDSHVYEHATRYGEIGTPFEDALASGQGTSIRTPKMHFKLTEADFRASIDRLDAISRIGVANGKIYPRRHLPPSVPPNNSSLSAHSA